MNNKDDLFGVVVPIITPVDDNDCVDESAFRKLIQILINSGVNGLFIGGSAGEGPLLTDTEWRRMMEIAFDENKGQVFLFAGTNDTSTARAKEKVKAVKEIGYKCFVLTSTYYLASHTAEERLRFFGACKEAGGDMEMIAYNIPQNIGKEIFVETLCELAKRKWIRYCKESSGNVEYFKRLAAEGGQVGLKVFEGDEQTMADGLAAGACGIVPVCANYEPRTYVDLYQAAANQDFDKVRQFHRRVLYLKEKLVLSGPFWLTGIKYAVSTLGIGNGRTVGPLEQVNEKQKAVIDDIRDKLALSS